MSTSTMHFGPEWMRTKHQPASRLQHPPSPPLPSNSASGLSTYSALVSSAPVAQQEKQDITHPFRYSKEELLKIYKESPKGGLGLEVERWEGVVREVGDEPIGLREMADMEKKLFAGPLNSDLRRRQSTDYLSPLNTTSLGTERPRMNHNSSSATSSPLRDRYPTLKRRDSNSESPTVNIPRKQSLSTLQAPNLNSRNAGLPSPRTRTGYNTGFDGVLNIGDTWTSRRRASEASLKAAGIGRDLNNGDGDDEKASGIQEEKEEEINGTGRLDPDNSHGQEGGTDIELQLHGSSTFIGHTYAGNTSSTASDTIRLNIADVSSNTSDILPVLQDMASVEWSYKDPSGNVQGPFRADLMQKWYNDGYFSPDLPMKRTRLDSQWTTVEDLTKRAASDKVFLTPLLPSFPPGLSRQDSSSTHGPSPVDLNVFNHPYQPAPKRSLRSSALESFAGSNPSDSPSSSFGAAHFGNVSPEPSTFGGRSNNGSHFAADNGINLVYPGALEASSLRRGHLLDLTHESPHRLHSPSYGNLAVGQGVSVDIDGYGFGEAYNPAQTVWNTSMHQGFSAYSHNLDFGPNSFGPASFNVLQNGQLPNQGRINSVAYDNSDTSGQLLHFDDKANTNQMNTIVSGLPLDLQHFSHSSLQQFQQTSSLESNPLLRPGINNENVALRSPLLTQASGTILTSHTQIAWDSSVEDATIRRPGPFEATHPTSLNTITTTSQPPPLPWSSTAPSLTVNSQSKDLSPWAIASQGIVDGSWTEPGPNSLTVRNVDQHNQQQEKSVEQSNAKELSPVETRKPERVAPEASNFASVPPAPAKARDKVPAPQPSSSKPSSEFLATSKQKAVWAKDSEKKKKTSGLTVSLREIQDAEVKAADARKAEKEKVRANRAAAAIDIKEDVQPFTTSWGLPTSQAGTRSMTILAESLSASTPVISTPAVWTTTTKPTVAKKTMKEIQEEEATHKKLASKETVAVVAAKRAYAESTAKLAASTLLTNNAWVTVGPSGKTTPATPSPVRPAALSVVSGSTSSARLNGVAIVRSPASIHAPKPVSPAVRIDDTVVSPSHEFLKWLSESLKGLNNSVNVEEIISMLLSFSLEPDPSTVEIISDTIYANSTTLDGRRFAAEFVSKRKADSANRLKSPTLAGKPSGKPVSIADVVKATPKAAQPEWGFKVVNKKKKGSRP